MVVVVVEQEIQLVDLVVMVVVVMVVVLIKNPRGKVLQDHPQQVVVEVDREIRRDQMEDLVSL
tara:strand:- start:14 stop:202 length:189 start_codon:yes stop_codon:yes gene_type:complete